MRRLVIGVIVLVVLAGGASLLANLSSPRPESNAATGGQGTRTAGSSALRQTRAAPKVPVRSAATPAPDTRTTTVQRGAARGQSAVADVAQHRRAAAQHGRHAPAATVQVVNPDSVTLPSSGPLLLLNPNNAAPGGTINVLGSGFDARKLVTLTLLPGALSKQQRGIALDIAQAGRDGTFSKNVTLPATMRGPTFQVSAQERNGATSAMAQGTIATGSPTATLSTAAGKPGDVVYASARGFDPNERVDVFLNNLGTTPVTTLHAGGSGGLSLARIPVPYGPVGPTAILLLGRHSDGLAAIPFEMLGLYPTASVSSYAAVADTVLRFSASGFGPDEAVDVRVNTPDGYAVGKLRADGAGNVRNEGQFRIPFSLKGRNTFVLTGEQSHTSTTVTFTVQPYQPLVAPSSYGGGPGTAITFYGSGFARNETVRVSLGQQGGQQQQVATMRTDGRGNLIARPGLISIKPDTRPGKLVFTLAGDKSVTPATATFTVQAASGPVDIGTGNSGGGQ